MSKILVRASELADRLTVDALHDREWGGPDVVAHDVRYDLRELPTLVAVDGAGAVRAAGSGWLDGTIEAGTIEAGRLRRLVFRLCPATHGSA